MDQLPILPTISPHMLAGMTDVQPGRIVSMAHSRSEHCQMLLLTFIKNA